MLLSISNSFCRRVDYSITIATMVLRQKKNFFVNHLADFLDVELSPVRTQ